MNQVKILKPDENGILVEIERIEEPGHYNHHDPLLPVIKGHLKKPKRRWSPNVSRKGLTKEEFNRLVPRGTK